MKRLETAIIIYLKVHLEKMSEELEISAILHELTPIIWLIIEEKKHFFFLSMRT